MHILESAPFPVLVNTDFSQLDGGWRNGIVTAGFTFLEIGCGLTLSLCGQIVLLKLTDCVTKDIGSRGTHCAWFRNRRRPTSNLSSISKTAWKSAVALRTLGSPATPVEADWPLVLFHHVHHPSASTTAQDVSLCCYSP